MANVLEVKCSGTPYEIGHQHGSAAKAQVSGSLAFYQALFQKTCSMDWKAVHQEAAKYIDPLERICPRYVEEMRGLADGAGVQLLDIVALNVRTEITFGLFTDDPELPVAVDGCTSLATRNPGGKTLLAQNWDWQVDQAENLIVCHVSHPGTALPDFTIVTEAGVIGKIGFNSSGVGVCLNAIRARGVDISKLPAHLALRTALESTSARAAAEEIQSIGTAGSGHILIADENVALGLECTSTGIKVIEVDGDGNIVHANHLVLDHPDVREPPWLPDSEERADRMTWLLQQRQQTSGPLDEASVYELFQDTEGYPRGINRYETGVSGAQTLFNIIMDLAERSGWVTFGQPTNDSKRLHFSF
ncbi:hypothetical protein ACJ41O_001909 [Fusarium nematophilum]